MYRHVNTLIKFSVFLFIFIRCGMIFASETGKISGVVSEKKTGQPLVGASIVVSAVWVNNEEIELLTPYGAATNTEGQYFILNVRPGDYSIQCTYMGYKREKIVNVKVYIDRSTIINYNLEMDILKGEDVVVTAYKPNKVERDLTATKQSYTISEVEQLAGIKNITDILDLQADVIDNHIRGGREGESQNLLGGASINNPLSGNRSFAPMVAALQEVEVLTSGFSAEYGNAQSGVINMVTREGGMKWSTRFDLSMDLPHAMVWGGNPYSEDNMPFYTLLSNPEEWLKPYIEDGQLKYIISNYNDYLPTSSHYNNIADPFVRAETMYNDSLKVARMAASAWSQMARQVGLDYNPIPQHQLEFTSGGPLNKYIRLFIAARQTKTKPVVPIPQDNLDRQWMNNLTIQPNRSNKVTLAYHYNYSYKNSVGGPLNWLDQIIHNSKTIDVEQLIGSTWNHVFSSASYMDLSFQVLDTRENEKPVFLDPDRYVSNAFSEYYAGRYDNTPSGHRSNNLSYNRGTEKTRTYTLNANFIKQINGFNLLKTGIQFKTYSIDVDQEFHLTSPGEYTYSTYSASPFEGAVFIQDKMEFEGFIANIGLRYDFYNFNYKYFSNLYTPLFNPYYPDMGTIRDPEYAEKEKTKIFGRLQPRLGISFPVSDNTVFHLNYGTFIQRPGFNYILRTEYTSRNAISEIGNAKLKPEKTSAWDIGIVHALPFGFRLDVSTYFKDVKDLTEEAVFVNSANEAYLNYTNRDYANIKGFHVNLEKSGKLLSAYIKYNYQTAKGKASAPGGALVTYYETPLSDGTMIDLPDPRDILMDYDRTHRLIINTRFNTSAKSGPIIFNCRPFSSISFSVTYKFQSGRPYTDDDQLLGLVLNKRMPSFSDLRLKIQKTLTIGDVTFSTYLEGYNILNVKEWSRQIFTDEETLRRWKNGDRESLIWYDPVFEEDPNETRAIYQYSDAYSVYNNEPRYFSIGLRIQL